MYLHKELETLTRTEIENLQLERLKKTIARCMQSPFYQKRFAEHHLKPDDIRSLDDLSKIANENILARMGEINRARVEIGRRSSLISQRLFLSSMP